jgi:hypothetical protein
VLNLNNYKKKDIKMKTNKRILAMTLCMSSFFTTASVFANTELTGVTLDNQSVTFYQAEEKSAAIAISNTVDQMIMQNQRPFKIGRREQRVRFFLSRPAHIKTHITDSPQEDKMKTDRKKGSQISPMAFIAGEPTDNALSEISEGARYPGLVVNPVMISCLSELLKKAKVAGDNNPNIMENAEIDEFNLFLLPVQNAAHLKTIFEPTKLQISPVSEDRTNLDPAINIQIPFLLSGGKCLVPTSRELGKAMAAAYKKGDDNRLKIDKRVNNLLKKASRKEKIYTEQNEFMLEKENLVYQAINKCTRKNKTSEVNDARNLIQVKYRTIKQHKDVLSSIVAAAKNRKIRRVVDLESYEKKMTTIPNSVKLIDNSEVRKALDTVLNCNVKATK